MPSRMTAAKRVPRGVRQHLQIHVVQREDPNCMRAQMVLSQQVHPPQYTVRHWVSLAPRFTDAPWGDQAEGRTEVCCVTIHSDDIDTWHMDYISRGGPHVLRARRAAQTKGS